MYALEGLADCVCLRPGMYVGCEKFAAVCAYLAGFDAARDGEPLLGFHPWLVLRARGGDNVGWPWLVIREALGQTRTLDELDGDDDRLCIAKLRELLKLFQDERKHRSAESIFDEYHQWQRLQR